MHSKPLPSKRYINNPNIVNLWKLKGRISAKDIAHHIPPDGVLESG